MSRTNNPFVSFKPEMGMLMNVPLLTALPLSNAGGSFCHAYFVPCGVPINSGSDDDLSVRCVVPIKKGESRVSAPPKQVEFLQSVE